MIRRALVAFLTFALRLFFRRIEVSGVENVPRDTPVVFAVNHPNGLIDPLFLFAFAPRPVSFLAKAPLFRMPVIGFFARRLETIPVYRQSDAADMTKNREMFAATRALLARGGSIAIFPEGTTHSDPKLRQLKTGAARIALGAAGAGAAVLVVPAGIHYTSKQTFRSAAVVSFGVPFAVEGEQLQADGEPAPESVARVTKRIEEALATVTLQAESRQAQELIARAEGIFSSIVRPAGGLAAQLDLRRRFTAGYVYLCGHDPVRLDRIESNVRRFEAELGEARLEAEELSVPGGWANARMVASALLYLLLALPLAAVGTVINYPIYRLIRLLSSRFSGGEDEVLATMKFVAAIFLYPLVWLVIAFVLWRRFGIVPAVVELLIAPAGGYVALRLFERLDAVTGRLRAIARFLRGDYAFLRLVAQRRQIRDEIFAIAEEMEGSAPQPGIHL
jgi:glycerol-3-phosphate O-acyltransferase/dihydroxyacetone phosphate acyltransferase